MAERTSPKRNRVKFSYCHQSLLSAFWLIRLIVSVQHDASPEPLQISMVLTHRKPPVADGEHMESMKKPPMHNIKRFSYHQGKDEIRHNAEA
jgi:hypothetical protein